MLPTDQIVQSLRAALAVSPENVPLRRHLAETLAAMARYDEAVAEYRTALRDDPTDRVTKLGLAKAYYAWGKRSEAMVIVEDQVQQGGAPGAARVLYARLLHLSGDVPNAVAQYKLGAEMDESAADPAFAEQLGISAVDDGGEVFDGRVRRSAGSGSGEWDADVERPKFNFGDVGGMHDLKEEIAMKIIYPLKHPEMYQAYGKKAGGGILMYGPPGCGKTHLARATAGEIQAGFLSIGINDVLDMWIGNSERNLHELFQHARQNKPCVLFFDEVDALGSRRSDLRTSAGRNLINQFLSEMDGIDAANDGVLVLAATNAPWHIDPAFRRPGRFDRVLFVPPPDKPARAGILQIMLTGKPTENIDCDTIANRTEGFSGADLKAVVDQAIEAKLRQAMKAGVPRPLTSQDLLAAASKLRPTTREWFSSARNYALYSNQDGIYDDILKHLKM